ALLNPSVKFVAEPRIERRRIAWSKRTQDRIQHLVITTLTGKHEVLVERRLLRSRVRRTQHRSSLWNAVCKAKARLCHSLNREPVIDISAYPGVDQPVARGDLILAIHRELLYCRTPMPRVHCSAARQIIRRQHRVV